MEDFPLFPWWFLPFAEVIIIITAFSVLALFLSGGQIRCMFCGRYNNYKFRKPKRCDRCGEILKVTT